MNIEEIIKWSIEHSIEKKTIEGFEGLLLNYEIDNPEEYKSIFGAIDKKDLEYQIHTVSLNLGNWPKCNYNTISASMWVSYKEKQICSYKMLFTFDGVPEDDFFDVV